MTVEETSETIRDLIRKNILTSDQEPTKLEEIGRMLGTLPPGRKILLKAVKQLTDEKLVRGIPGRGIEVLKQPREDFTAGKPLSVCVLTTSPNREFLPELFAGLNAAEAENPRFVTPLVVTPELLVRLARSTHDLRHFFDAMIILSPMNEEQLSELMPSLKMPILRVGGGDPATLRPDKVVVDESRGGELAAECIISAWSRRSKRGASRTAVHLLTDEDYQLDSPWIVGCIRRLLMHRVSISIHRCDRLGVHSNSLDVQTQSVLPLEDKYQLRGEPAGRFMMRRILKQNNGPSSTLMASTANKPPVCCITVGPDVTSGAVDALQHFNEPSPSNALLVALDPESRLKGAYISKVQTDWREVGRACRLAILNLPGGNPLPLPSSGFVLLKNRRTTGSWLHKIFRSVPATIVIKNMAGEVQFGNPVWFREHGWSFEEIRNKKPSVYWGTERGGEVEEHDSRTPPLAQGRDFPDRSLLTVTDLSDHTRLSHRFTFRWAFRVAGVDFLGSFGIDIDYTDEPDEHVDGYWERSLKKSINENDSIEDPPDEVLEAYFRTLPSAVSVFDISPRDSDVAPRDQTGASSGTGQYVYGNVAFETLFGLSHLDQTGVDVNELFQAQINSEKSGAHGEHNTSLRMNETNVRSFFLALKTKAPAGLDWASLPPERLWSEQRLVMTYDAENSFFEPEVVVRFGFHRQILKEALKIGKEPASLPPASRRRQLVLDPMIGWVLDTGVALSWEI